MINRTKVKESTQIKPGDNGDVLVMKDNAPEWSTPSDADLAKVSDTDAKLAEKQDKLTAGDNIKIEGNVISAASEPTPISIGTVTEGDTAMVSNSGTDTNVVLNFVMPKGVKGDKGPQGDPGTAATVTVGTTTTGEAGTEASVTNSGTTSAAVLNFVIPKGDKGDKGEKGDPGQAGTQVNNLAPLKVNTAPTTDADTVANVAVGELAKATIGDLSGLSEENRTGIEALIEEMSGACNTSIGAHATATGFSCTAIGYGAAAGSNLYDNTVGDDPFRGGYVSIALGPAAIASETGSISIGSAAESKSPLAIAIGHTAKAKADDVNNGPVAIGLKASATGASSVAIGANSKATEENEFSVGFSVGDTNLTRRITHVADPTNDQDAATKNYVDTQLTPINAKLQYVPENTNQTLSLIETNVEKAQSAADAKVASITAGTGISVDASNPTAPIVSTVGLATQASVDTLTTTVNSKANQTDLEALQTTVAGKADTSALANYATKTELNTKADQSAVDAKVSSVTAGTGISITGTATNPVINATGGDSYITKSSSLEEAYAIGDDAVNHRANEVTVGSVEPSGGFLQPGEFTRLIAGVSTPTNRYDAANKLYVDQQVQKMVAVPDYANGTDITSSFNLNSKYDVSANGFLYVIPPSASTFAGEVTQVPGFGIDINGTKFTIPAPIMLPVTSGDSITPGAYTTGSYELTFYPVRSA